MMRKTKFCFYVYICICILFFASLFLSLAALYKTAESLKSFNATKARRYEFAGRGLYSFSRLLKIPVLPVLYITATKKYVDRVIGIEEQGFKISRSSAVVIDNVSEIGRLIAKTDRSEPDMEKLSSLGKRSAKELETVSYMLSVLQKKLKNKEISTYIRYIDFGRVFFLHMDVLLAKNSENKYLAFFLNNRELRPGGGFIGSYGMLRFNKYSLKETKIEDVYETDGQLKEHVEPPDPVRIYLQLPNWYLRDSNFSPDFSKNVYTAELLIEKSIGEKDFYGAVGITTSAILSVLDAIGPVYIPDYKLTINKDNFYIQTQTRVEKNFFPGSRQKRNFLSSLFNAIKIKIESESISKEKLIKALLRSLDEKDIVIFSKQKDVQNAIALLNWGGLQKRPLYDYIFPVDANVGANKTNTFITRDIVSSVTFPSANTLRHTFTMVYKNSSPVATFPGGTYKNYLQLYIPRSASVRSLSINSKVLTDYVVESANGLSNVVFYFEVKPKKNATIKLVYELSVKKNGKLISYNLLVQKQIGSYNNTYKLEIVPPKHFALFGSNPSFTIKNGVISFESSLRSDSAVEILFRSYGATSL